MDRVRWRRSGAGSATGSFGSGARQPVAAKGCTPTMLRLAISGTIRPRPTQIGAVIGAAPRLVPPLGANSRFFPSNREFRRFCPDDGHLAAKTARQIKPLPVNSRSTANREFTPAEPGIKFAEPGIISSQDGRHQQRAKKRPISPSHRNQIDNKSNRRGQSYRDSWPFMRPTSRATAEKRVPALVTGRDAMRAALANPGSGMVR